MASIQVSSLIPGSSTAWLNKLKSGGKPVPAGGGGAAPATNGKQLFSSNGCVACHTLADAGATGTTGPDLDKVLKGRDPAFIKQSIVAPNAYVAPGYKPGVMPPSFASQIPAAQLNQLVQYLAQHAT